MKKIIKTLLVVMVVVLALTAFVGCNECQHTGGTATCTEAAVCELCGESYGEALGHTGGAATCTEKAVCEVCGESYGEAAGHKVVKLPAIEATCSKEGVTESAYCSVCRETLVARETVAKLEHVWVPNTQSKAPTCTESGYTGGNHCDLCGVQDGTIEILEPTCTWGEPFVYAPATCEEQGLLAVECQVCGELALYGYIDATGHSLVDVEAKAATCTEDGYTAHKACGNEGCDYTEGKEVLPGGHALVDVEAKEATCAVAGYTAHKACENCDYTEGKEVVDATGEHADGTGDYKCDVCGTKMLPADGTTLTISQALAIAKMQSHNTYTTQNYYITGTVTGLYNTQYGNFYIEDEDGNKICIYGLYKDGTRYDAMSYKPVNGDVVTVYGPLGAYNTTYQMKNAELDEVVAHEHDYVSVVTDPTCTVDGYTTHTCSICLASYVDSEVTALGHTTESGTCENCGKEIGGEAVVETLATFDFGSNGSAAHVDGNDYGTSKSYTVSGYTLALTGMSKVYGPAYDEKGNSCLKLGTSSKTGTFSFTVADNVTEVVIYVAGYKAATSTKVIVNGTTYTVTTTSNNGDYTAITIDTTTTKTITFTTSTYRCMIDSIVFNGYAQ